MKKHDKHMTPSVADMNDSRRVSTKSHRLSPDNFSNRPNRFFKPLMPSFDTRNNEKIVQFGNAVC
jgi:hypothetical protein